MRLVLPDPGEAGRDDRGPQDPLGDEIERAVPAGERHHRGQFFTPQPLVSLVLDLAGRPPEGGVVLDPACGSGRFLIEIRRRWPDLALRGFETDPRALSAAMEQVPGASILGRDFLDAEAAADADLVVGNPPWVRDRGRRRDLYVDFVERALLHLRPGGTLAMVLSNAWLDVGYGEQVRGLLLGRCAIAWIVESAAQRWFLGPSVNAMVLVARRCDDGSRRREQPVRFAQTRLPPPAEPEVVRTLRQADLPRDRAWGPLLRAPDLWLRAQEATVPLGEIAHVERGWTTNDNAFFYPSKDSGIEECWLRPLVKGPKTVPGAKLVAGGTKDRVFLCDATRGELVRRGHTGALAWIERHGRLEWRLRPQRPARLLVVKGHHDRLRHPLADRPVHADQQMYLVRPAREPGDDGAGQLVLPGRRGRAAVDDEVIAALLNSSWGLLSTELAGRVNFGDGVLWLGLRDARERLRLPEPRCLPASTLAELRRAWDGLPGAPVAPAAAERDDPAWGPARAALDAVVGSIMGLHEGQQEEVRHERIRLCRRRLDLAGSPGSEGLEDCGPDAPGRPR